MQLNLQGPSLMPESGGAPDSLVVLLHGVGADGNDLIGLAPYWADDLPDTAFFSPHAPFPCDMAPFGRQWFSLMSFDPDRVLAGIRQAAPILDSYIDGLLAAHGLAADRLAIVGFSQGSMMALYTAPRRATPLAGIVGFSGALYGGATLADDIRAKPPSLLIHGEDDGVVPFPSLQAAHARLKSVGVPVKAVARPGLAHGIDEIGIDLAGAFLLAALTKKAAAIAHAEASC